MRSTLSTGRYEVVAPAGKAIAIAAAGIGAGLAAIALLAVIPEAMRAQSVAWAAALGLVPIIALFCCLARRRSVTLEADVLVIRAGMHTRRVKASRLELERARILDLEERPELLPGRGTFGASLPDYQTGWFRTRQWGKGFYLLTDRRRVLWLPEHGGPHLLLSVRQPQALLAALNAMVPRTYSG
ncbi:hypothetical protein [Lysobacter solisilvae (ex Woo and Kim 2020)]|uniref:Bacterial Pleckstrin homology domain-containing protein n=1 Tax=Agrilutibacter terrestris TaxID=2865112 RepID=A0A7H0FVM8_9GAMM|nr:hypothetical protein [Lysobacter terrestris]QNP40094.1 hypothetical protein H8B22_11400 [Lysobacter terrestris]